MRESRKAKERRGALTDPAVEQGLPSSSFARVPRVDALGPLPEADEYENDDFVTLYDTSKGLADSCGEDGPRLFGESSTFAFSQSLSKGGQKINHPSTRRPEFWTIPSVRSSRSVFRPLHNLFPVDASHPQRVSGFACVPGAEFDAPPPGHLLQHPQHYLANSTPADL